jgi:hypothetical protein
VFGLVAAGCGPATQESSNVAEATARPTATATGAPSVTTASVEVTPPKPAATESPFVAVATLPYPIHLHASEGALLGAAPMGTDNGVIPMGIIEGDKFIDKPDLALKGDWLQVVAAAGTWPQGVDLLVMGTTGRTGIAQHYTLNAEGGWFPKSSRVGHFYAGVAKVGETTLALEMSGMMGTNAEFVPIRGPKVVRTITKVDKACEKGMKDEGFPPATIPKNQLFAASFGGTHSGALVAVGSVACAEHLAAEIWDNGSTTSRIVPLPVDKTAEQVASDPVVVRGSGSVDAWILAGHVYAFDGKDLRAVPPIPNGVFALKGAAGPNGELYVITNQRSHYDKAKRENVVDVPSQLLKTDGKTWTPVPLPGAPESVATDKSGVVWVATSTALLRTKKSVDEKSIAVAPVGAAPGAGAGAAKPTAEPRKAPRAPGPLCPSNVVVLYGFTKVTPDDYDFPKTREALKGHKEFESARFVVAKDGGQKFFSALVTDVKMGRQLVKLIEKNVTGSKPQLVCSEPEIVRELKINLQTGDVIK